MMHNMGDFGGMSFGGMGFGWIFQILFLVLVIVGFVFLVKYIVNTSKKEEKKRQQKIFSRNAMPLEN